MQSIEEIEAEPSLGNGGLGRLAACFLRFNRNSGINRVTEIGLNYHFGLVQAGVRRQRIGRKNRLIHGSRIQSWLRKTDVTYPVTFGKLHRYSPDMYDIEVTGYNNRTNKLHLFDIETVDETIVEDGIISLIRQTLQKNLTSVLISG